LASRNVYEGMTAVLVHGDPETDAIWEPLLESACPQGCGVLIPAGIRRTAQRDMVHAGAGLERAAAKPGLSLLATVDTFVSSELLRRRAGERAGGHTEVLPGLSHWWMAQDPAEELTRFWDSVE
jgi:hypothetical protein